MIALARIADRGPLTAAVLAAGLLLAALAIPTLLLSGGSFALFVYVGLSSMAALVASAAVVAFVALRHGELAAIRVAAGCSLLLVLPILLFDNVIQAPLVASLCWLAAIAGAIVLARTAKLDTAMLVITGCGVLSVLFMVLIMGNTTEFLAERFSAAEIGADVTISTDIATETDIAQPAKQESAPELTQEMREQLVNMLVYLTTGAIGVSVMGVASGALFLARSWQARLVNQGGFQKEFHALSLGRNAALVSMIVVAMAMIIGGQILIAAAMVVIFAFFFQGLAIVHALVKQHGMHRFWLHGVYALFILLMLPTTLLLAALGFVDNLSSLRRTEGK